MVKLSSMRADIAAERDGVWATYEGDFKVKIASSATSEFRDKLEAVLEPYRALEREGKFTEEMRQSEIQKLASTALARDWSGAEDEDGKPIPFSPEAFFKVVSDPGMHRFWKWFQVVAGNDTRYRESETKKALGN